MTDTRDFLLLFGIASSEAHSLVGSEESLKNTEGKRKTLSVVFYFKSSLLLLFVLYF